MNVKLNPSPTLPLDDNNNDPQQSTQDILAQAQHEATEVQLNFSGSLDPIQAWALVQRGDAVLVDVRTNEERKFVGYIEASIHVAWATGTAFNRNPRFLKELEHKVSKQQVVLLLCRSGKRSALAAAAAFKAGFKQVYSVLEGFEGELNARQQRNQHNGWKARHLPWQQD